MNLEDSPCHHHVLVVKDASSALTEIFWGWLAEMEIVLTVCLATATSLAVALAVLLALKPSINGIFGRVIGDGTATHWTALVANIVPLNTIARGISGVVILDNITGCVHSIATRFGPVLPGKRKSHLLHCLPIRGTSIDCVDVFPARLSAPGAWFFCVRSTV